MNKILIVEAKFYEKISGLLLQGAIAEISKNDFGYEIVEVPGAFEIPAAISFASKSNEYDGFLALGCVIRGQTTHYDYVCMESARGINMLAVKNNLAIGYGIITVENEEQALERADPAQKNKGAAAAKACIDMIRLKKKFLKFSN